ncbi:MAG: hypothetical protein ACYC91_02695 [Solirubrobacteraceae bacterium]
MRRFLFLHGGAEEARRVFREEERGYWSSALPLVLEKHGFLSLEEATLDVIQEALRCEQVGAVLVARPSRNPDTLAAVSRLLDSGCPVLVEGPLPPELHERLGISSAIPLAPEGSVGIANSEVAAAARAYGYPAGGRVGPAAVRPVDRDEATDWMRLDVGITAAQAKAWRTAGWSAERWSLSAASEVLATWTAEGAEPTPAVVRHGNLFATSFSLFCVVAQAHTAEPWYHGEYRSSARSTGLETLLLSIVDEMHRLAGMIRPRVLPWPRNARWVLNVRHDFDRFLEPPVVAEVLARHEAAGSAGTWYWRSRHLKGGLVHRRWKGNAALKLVARSTQHEVALHTEQLWNGAESECRLIERIAGHRLRGSSSHGDRTCFRFQGAPNVIWAERQGLLYTELIQHAHHHPHRFADLGEDGIITPLSVIMLPHHESLDRTSAGGDGDVARILRAGEVFSRAQGLLQVMNHPDINQDELFEALDGLSRAGRLDWTAARAADWWRRTHVRELLSVTPDASAGFRIRAQEQVEGLAVESLAPDGTRRISLVDLQAGESTAVAAVTGEAG